MRRRGGRQRSTSLSWSVATVVLLIGANAAVWWWQIDSLVRYESAAALATIDVPGTVTDSHSPYRGKETVTVSYRDPAGDTLTVTFAVLDAASHPVGSAFPLRMAPGSPEVYPVTDDAYTPTDTAYITFLVMLALAVLPVAWLNRALRWWRATAATPEPVTVRLFRTEYLGPTIYSTRATWIQVEDAQGRSWYQRVMWEPWLADFTKRAFPASGQRFRPQGPMLITTRQGGRIWWASRARRSEPRLEVLTPGTPRRGGTRWSLVVVSAVGGVLSAFWLGPVAVAVAFTYLFGVLIFYGAPPVDRLRL